ncbi:inositol polyphosphate-5-phosphatase A isoform X1 [Tribolium castaneum]|uniref:inositol-polyphosphate 5-phosphatase n=1 Tax=Tribolium castaneum TaxID=7070 RepID=D6X3B1_TRICA|nr:PREDICTED: type I inositol 1,4,5-trisphosphate 5-phosphatase isoform X1 [Tribolium castaneum]EFA09776.1 Type I inositol 1,4,5-trisphosphate 5-phosphatase-like Protein [Tribolium castaneum]|eukprot:XP_008198047.1 PREDICTED: type I inositol 1,4,5-trisphosphate 5-phosphatase isoform X1 [Tribolium castaneum]
MGSPSIPALLVTANVGSIFEDPSEMLKIWTEEFLSTVTKLDPKFIALHCQEVGGKNYENSMKHVEHFVKLLMSSNELRLFDKIRIFLDEDYSSAENFTALGNLYFIHESVENVLIWDFNDVKFVPVSDKLVHSGNIEAIATKEKAKFPQDFFPECKWSRKGFLRTRWSLNGTVLDLVNIHLFHDASNFIAMESYPSVYCKNRRRALEHTLQRFHNDRYGKAPYFVFGDFNFRTDTEGVIKKLTEGLTTTRLQNNKNNDYTKLQFANEDSQLVLTVGKKEFNHLDHQKVFLTPSPTWLKTFDKELEAFEKYLTEYPITFPPSYPFEENVSHARSYMQTRCPAWCDRVLLSHTAKQLVDEDEKVEYGLMGLDTCMGDHKPVYLRVELKSNSGTVKCCEHAPYECLPATCQCCQTFASVTINIVDMCDYSRKSYPNVAIDSQLLHEPITRDMLLHEPYTPESAESRSPMPEEKDKDEAEPVSAAQLKRRLEYILSLERKFPMTRSESANVEMRASNGTFFRNRAMSEVPRMRRMRLISTTSASSIHRFQSHHSSSDEDWYEYEEETGSKCSSEGRKSDIFEEIRPEKATKFKDRRRNRMNCCSVV